MIRPTLLLAWALAVPAFGEERTFTVTADGKSVGEVILAFKSQADGSTAVAVRAEVGRFAVKYRGTEVWKDGRLVRMDGSGMTLRATDRGYELQTGTKDVVVRGDVWPNSFAVLPGPGRTPLVVDVPSGDVHRCKIEAIGPDRVSVADKPIPATRYRVTIAGQPTDVWYDASGRLVRRSWPRDGRAVVQELTRLKPD
jgi:hypothetical protein